MVRAILLASGGFRKEDNMNLERLLARRGEVPWLYVVMTAALGLPLIMVVYIILT
jgi:hypothetical protein